ncbi:MAG TPA: ABC transporter ATP-binding protein [Streptosporangiaceae bacterium]|jgi:oligopeptide/dipeptide ABC transporter ATP-binding protein
MTGPMLELDGVRVGLRHDGRVQTVIHDASLTVSAGEALGLVGESGSGKSLTARAIARLLPGQAEVSGGLRFGGAAVYQMGDQALRDYRTRGISQIFQDPRAHINPVRKIGDFLTEALVTNLRVPRAEAARRGIGMLTAVGIDDAPRRLGQYPHQLSGGLLQRVMIAAALLTEPRLLLADEPTTALDVTTQAEVMAILDELRRERGLAMLFITHDLELAAAVCDRIAVMYAGSIVETRAAGALISDPLHPYTAALLRSRPSMSATARRLPMIGGRPLTGFEVPPGCAFVPRCPHALPSCELAVPPLRRVEGDLVACHRAEELRHRLTSTAPEATSER